MIKLSKLIICSTLGLSMLFGSTSSLYAQELKIIGEESQKLDKSTDRLQVLFCEIEKINFQINELEINVKMELDTQLCDVLQIKKSLMESLQSASLFSKFSIKKQIKVAEKLEAEIEENKLKNAAKIEELKEEEKKLQLEIDNELRSKINSVK